MLLALLLLRVVTFYQSKPEYLDNQTVTFTTTLLSEPQLGTKFQKFSTELPGGDRVSVTTSLYPNYHYGEELKISGRLKFVTLKNGSNFKVINFPKIEVNKANKNLFLKVTSGIRQKIISTFQKTLDPISSGLLLGIVFGIRENIEGKFLEDLRTSGVLHVVAASGMNVTMTGGFLSIISALFFRRQIAIFLSILGIIFYAILAGLEPSIIRASIMGILVFTAQILGKQSWSVVGLMTAAFVMLFIKPTLLFDIGFQLSFLATLGLIYIRLPIKESIFTEGFSTTIAAQIMTLPVILANFGTYSFWSVMTNTLVLWTIPFLMVLGGVAAILGLLFESLATPFLFLSLPLLLIFQNIVSFFASIGGVAKIESVSWSLIAGYYVLILAFLLRKNR